MSEETETPAAKGETGALAAARGLLAPGERLLWAGWGEMSRQVWRGARTLPLFMLPLFLLFLYSDWRSYRERVAFWDRVPGPHPQPGGFDPWTTALFMGVFLLVFCGLIWLVTRLAGRMRALYAVTDRRVLVGYGLPGQSGLYSSQSFSPNEITCVEIRPGDEGRGDIVFARRRGAAAQGMMIRSRFSFDFGVLPGISMGGTRGESGFYGVYDAETPAALLRQLRAGSLANAPEAEPDEAAAAASVMAPSPVEQALPALAPARVVEGLRSEREMVFDASPPRGFSFCFALMGTLFLLLGIWNGWSYFLFTLVGLLFAGIGFAGLLWTDTLFCDSVRRTYRLRRGFLPFVGTRLGGWGDWERVAIVSVSAWRWKAGMGLPWKDGKGGYYLYLFWRGGAPGFPFGGVGGNELARQVGQALALRLDLPLSLESTPAPASRSDRQRRLALLGKWALPALLALTWLNARLNLVTGEDHWKDRAGNRYLRQSSLWHSETYAASPDGEVATYLVDYTLLGNSGSGRQLRVGNPNDRLDYGWTLRWGSRAVVAERQRQAELRRAWERNRAAVLERRAQRLRAIMEPVGQARASDPGNVHGAISRALIGVAGTLEQAQAYDDAERLYKEAVRVSSASAPRDLAAAHLGVGRCYEHEGLKLLARSQFERAAAVPGCPDDLAVEAHRELNALPR